MMLRVLQHNYIKCTQDFPGGPVVKIPSSQCRVRGFDPWHLILKSGKEGVTGIKVPTDPERVSDLPRSH